MKVSNKVVAVTGGGSGIGRELVLELVRRGAKVAALDVSKDGLDATVALTDAASVLPLMVDITNRERVEQVPGEIAERFGAVDGLINCAGIIQPFVPLVEVDYGVIDRVMQVNFFGTLYMTKAFLPHLLERPEGHLTNVSSMGGFMPFPGQTLYGASKAGRAALFTLLALVNARFAALGTDEAPWSFAKDASGSGSGAEKSKKSAKKKGRRGRRHRQCLHAGRACAVRAARLVRGACASGARCSNL